MRHAVAVLVPLGDAWKRGGLSLRDRSLVTAAAFVAGGHADEMCPEIDRALGDGLRPDELDGEIDQLACHAGRPVAAAAARVAEAAYAAHGVGATRHPPDGGSAPVGEAAGARRAGGVRSAIGSVAPGLADLTDRVLLGDVWRRPDLAPRDRGFVAGSGLGMGRR